MNHETELEIRNPRGHLNWVISFISAFAFGMAHNAMGVVVGNMIIIFLGLTIVGCMVQENRWVNIMVVSAGLWVTSLLNVAFSNSYSFSSWMWSLVVIAIIAALSGVISLLITAFINAARA